MTGIILAAGKSKRMNLPIPKVLLPLNRQPVLSYILATALACNLRIIIVVGRQHSLVRKRFSRFPVKFVIQRRINGTARAVLACAPELKANDQVLILSGDTPLLKPKTLKNLIATHRKEKAEATLLTAVLEDPRGYGRIIRNRRNEIIKIVEERDASSKIKKLKEINSGVYIFNWNSLFPILKRLKPSPITREYYLTDAVREIRKRKGRIKGLLIEDPTEILGINTPREFALVSRIMKQRMIKHRATEFG